MAGGLLALRLSAAAGTDCHMHVKQNGDFPQDADRVRSALEGAGLKRACIFAGGYYAPEGCQGADCPSQRSWTEKANDWTLDQAKTGKDLLPFCGVPLREAWAPEEVRRCAAKGARGLKVHPVSEDASLRDPKIFAALGAVSKAAARARLPILIHIAFEDEEITAFYKLAAERPRATFILAHQLGPKLARLAEAPANVLVDISGLPLAPRAAAPGFVALWRKVGMKRILLGSDWPLLHPSEYTAALRAFPLTEEERRMIVEDNARRLFP